MTSYLANYFHDILILFWNRAVLPHKQGMEYVGVCVLWEGSCVSMCCILKWILKYSVILYMEPKTHKVKYTATYRCANFEYCSKHCIQLGWGYSLFHNLSVNLICSSDSHTKMPAESALCTRCKDEYLQKDRMFSNSPLPWCQWCNPREWHATDVMCFMKGSFY